MKKSSRQGAATFAIVLQYITVNPDNMVCQKNSVKIPGASLESLRYKVRINSTLL